MASMGTSIGKTRRKGESEKEGKGGKGAKKG
jgi:hypothetical protein